MRHGRNDAHKALVPVGPESARVAIQTSPRTSPGPVHLRLQIPQVIVGGLLGQSPAEVPKLASAPGARSTVERLHRHGREQAEQLLEQSTDSEAVS